jgi:hypothetical protein
LNQTENQSLKESKNTTKDGRTEGEITEGAFEDLRAVLFNPLTTVVSPVIQSVSMFFHTL